MPAGWRKRGEGLPAPRWITMSDAFQALSGEFVPHVREQIAGGSSRSRPGGQDVIYCMNGIITLDCNAGQVDIPLIQLSKQATYFRNYGFLAERHLDGANSLRIDEVNAVNGVRVYGLLQIIRPCILRNVVVLPETQRLGLCSGVLKYTGHIKHTANSRIGVERLLAIGLSTGIIIGFGNDVAIAQPVHIIVILIYNQHFMIGARLQDVAAAPMIGIDAVGASSPDAANISCFAHIVGVANVQRSKTKRIVHKTVAMRTALMLGRLISPEHILFTRQFIDRTPIGIHIPTIFTHRPITVEKEGDTNMEFLQFG